jgi:hypothetical protein
MDYPEMLMQGKSAEQILKDAGTVDAYNMNGTVVREQALSLDRHVGREVHVEYAETAMRIRLYLVNARLYKAVALRPKSRAFSPDDERFLALLPELPLLELADLGEPRETDPLGFELEGRTSPKPPHQSVRLEQFVHSRISVC